MSRRYTAVFKTEENKKQKDVRKIRRLALNEALNQSTCDVDAVKNLIDEIIADQVDTKKLNYSDPDNNIEYPFNKAACMGHVEVVEYMLKHSDSLHINLKNPMYRMVLSVVAHTIKDELKLIERDIEKLLRLEDMLLLLLSNQKVVDETLSALNIDASETFGVVFAMMLGKAEDIFKTQDTLALRLLSAMREVRVKNLPPVAADLQDHMRTMLDVPPSALKIPKYWVTYLYTDIAKKQLSALKPGFLSMLMQVGYKMSLMDADIFNLLKQHILSQDQEREVSLSLMVALLEGVICCQSRNGGDISIPYILNRDQVMPLLLEYCKQHYIDSTDASVWLDHLPIIHYLIANQKAEVLLKEIASNFAYHELYQELKKWAMLSKSVKHHQHFTDFRQLLETVEASMPNPVLVLEDLEPILVEDDTETTINPYHTLKKFTNDDLRSKTLQKKLTSGLLPSGVAQHVTSKLPKAAASAVSESRSEDTMQSKKVGLRNMAQMSSHIIEKQRVALQPPIASSSSGSSSQRSSGEVDALKMPKSAQLKQDDGEVYAVPDKNQKSSQAKPGVSMYKLTEEVQKADAAIKDSSSLEVVCVTDMPAEKAPTVEAPPKASVQPSVAAKKPVPPAKPPVVAAKPVPAAKPASVSSAKPQLSAAELALKSSTIAGKDHEIAKLMAKIAAMEQKQQSTVDDGIEDLPPPPPPEEFLADLASTSVAGNSSALFVSASANKQALLPKADAAAASSEQKPTAPVGMFNELLIAATRKTKESASNQQALCKVMGSSA